MITMKRCSEVADTLVYEGFQAGFADYMIQIEMDEEFFVEHFFGPEGNQREFSFLALEGEKPVGVILSGIKTNEAFKTLRCGGMALIPSHRGSGLAMDLMQLHEQTAREQGCRQLALEVIKGNDRAIHFYQKMGYEIVTHMQYREWHPKEEAGSWEVSAELQARVEAVDLEAIKKLRETELTRLPWQGSFPYFEGFPTKSYGIRVLDRLVAGLVATPRRLLYIWVDPAFRNRGFAKAMLNCMVEELQPEVMRVSYLNNVSFHTFANHLGMGLDEISQWEMVKWLG